MKSTSSSRLGNLGVNKLLYLGFGAAVIAVIFLSLIAWKGLNNISAFTGAVTETARKVNSGVEAVSLETKKASDESKLIADTVELKLLPSTQASARDLLALEEVFVEIVENFTALTQESDLSVDDFIMEAEDRSKPFLS